MKLKLNYKIPSPPFEPSQNSTIFRNRLKTAMILTDLFAPPKRDESGYLETKEQFNNYFYRLLNLINIIDYNSRLKKCYFKSMIVIPSNWSIWHTPHAREKDFLAKCGFTTFNHCFKIESLFVTRVQGLHEFCLKLCHSWSDSGFTIDLYSLFSNIME